MSDLDFYIGLEAQEKRLNYNIDYPIRHGIVDNWDSMEKFWFVHCLFFSLSSAVHSDGEALEPGTVSITCVVESNQTTAH